MKLRLSFLLFLIFISAAFARAQDVNNCQQPFSNRFDEFDFTNIAAAKERFKKFEEAVGESSEARGFIYVYGGKKTRVNEAAQMMAEIRKVLKMGDVVYNPKFTMSDQGFRNLPGVELFIKPLDCSEFPASAASVEFEEVEFAEAPPESLLRKSSGEINKSLVKKTEPVCLPVPRAVRVCENTVEVYVIIDRKGDVIFAKVIAGHPLLRAAGENTVKNWKFQPVKIKDKTYNVAGYVTVEFHQPEETLDY
jgi:hypothetical protein